LVQRKRTRSLEPGRRAEDPDEQELPAFQIAVQIQRTGE